MLPRLTDATFARGISSSRPVLVTFTAPIRCGACRQQKPALEALSEEGIPVFIVDVEERDTAKTEAKLGGKGVPFTKVYANGQLLIEKVGLMDVQGLLKLYKEGSGLAAAAELSQRQPSPSSLAGARDHARSIGTIVRQFGRR